MSVSAYYQFEWGVNGYLLGVGKPVQVLSVDGLEDAPPVRSQDTTRGYADGMFTGRDFVQGRTIVLHLQVLADANGSMTANMAALKTAFQPQRSGVQRLSFWLPNHTYGDLSQYVFGRVRRRQVVVNPEYVYGRGEMLVEIFCPDPRVYSGGTLTSISASANAARGYPRTYPRTYGLASSAPVLLSTTVTNSGNYETGMKITIQNQCTNPIVYMSGSNAPAGQLVFQVSMADGDQLVIYTDSKTVFLNGAPARNLLATGSTWFNLPATPPPAGSPTLNIRFATSGVNASGSLQYASAYL